MMETIKSWAFSLCAAAIIGSVINMILPEGGMLRTFKIISCVFFLCAVITPLTEIKKSDLYKLFDTYSYKNTAETNGLDDTSAEYLENKILEATDEILKIEGIETKDISIKINISEESGIDINKFVLTFEHLEDTDNIADKIYKKTGIKPDIILSGES